MNKNLKLNDRVDKLNGRGVRTRAFPKVLYCIVSKCMKHCTNCVLFMVACINELKTPIDALDGCTAWHLYCTRMMVQAMPLLNPI